MTDTTRPPANDDQYKATLSPAEIVEICGYSQPSRQLAELKKRGFYRARRNPVTGAVILERPHYEAICETGGKAANDSNVNAGPKVRAPQVRRA
jgi:hypothetical protein